MRQSTQVLVIGGGPAGSTTAGLLAKQGVNVTVLERDRFPRYHIGESLLPSCLPVLNLLGARQKVEKHGFQVKPGVYFQWGPDNWGLAFNELGHDASYSWQVIRSEFDKLLLDHAAELGAEVHQGVGVGDIVFDGDRAVAANWFDAAEPARTGTIRFDYVVDASGRAGVFANRYMKNRQFNDQFKNIAAWKYWRGAKQLEGAPLGAAGVCSVPSGWFWIIPLHDGTQSIGLVMNRDFFAERRRALGNSDAVYDEAVKQCPGVQGVLDGAHAVSEIQHTQDYSYVSDSFIGPGYLLAGDAACFLDPLLSTGVHMATYSGMLSAASVGTVLRKEMSEDEAFGFYQRVYRRGYERMVLLVSAFYESYRGKDYHFYNAQRLSAREKNAFRLHDTFLRIISGIEDMEDAKESAYNLAIHELTGAGGSDRNPYRQLQRMRDEPVNPQNAVGGIYITFAPRLGLAKAEQRGANS